MQRLKKICDEISRAPNREKKIKILRRHESDVQWYDLLYYLLTPSITTGLKRKKLNDWYSSDKDSALEFCSGHGDDLIEYLTYICRGTKEDVKICWSTVEQYPEDMREFLLSIILRTYRMGLNLDVVNEAYGEDFFPVIKVPKPCDYFKNADLLSGKTFTVTPIVNGVRAVARCAEGDTPTVTIVSSMQTVDNIDFIIDEFLDIKRSNFVVDGYLVWKGYESSTPEETIKRSQVELLKSVENRNLYFVATDMLSLLEFEHKCCSTPYSERYDSLSYLIDSSFNNIKVVPALYSGDDSKIIIKLFNECISNGHNGLIVNLNDGLYTYERETKSSMKVVEIFEGIFKIKSYTLGYGSEKDFLRTLILNCEGQDVQVFFGFSKIQRENFGKMPDRLIGKFAKIQFHRQQSGKENSRVVDPIFIELASLKDVLLDTNMSLKK